MTQFRLHVTDGQTQKTVTVDRSPFTIGHRTTADFQVFNTDVSRDHAELTIDGDGCILRDRGSRFGTFVNDTRITEHSLQDGDVIRLGPRDGRRPRGREHGGPAKEDRARTIPAAQTIFLPEVRERARYTREPTALAYPDLIVEAIDLAIARANATRSQRFYGFSGAGLKNSLFECLHVRGNKILASHYKAPAAIQLERH